MEAMTIMVYDDSRMGMGSLSTVSVAASDPKPEPATDVDRVIDQLDRRLVPDGDRSRLRRHLDRADAPQRGRPGADEGLGRAIGRPAQSIGLRLP